MRHVAVLTNFSLLYLVLLIFLLFGLGIVFNPFASTAKLIIFFILALASNVLGAVAANILRVTLISEGSIWLQPVSKRTRTILINSVIFFWLCAIGLIIFILFMK